MLTKVKSFIARTGSRALCCAYASLGCSSLGVLINDCIEQVQPTITRRIRYGQHELTFQMPNSVNAFRIDTFATKEPETLSWIDALPTGCVLWDIGANVGLYSCYAAKARNCQVYAFEPSVFNIEILARNIVLNDLVDRVTVVPLPLSSLGQINVMRIPTGTRGGGAFDVRKR